MPAKHKHLNARSAAIMARLVDGLEPGESREIENTHGAFMALHVERLTEDTFSISHYYEQNGDLMPDPDMSLWRDDEGLWFPIALQQCTGHYTEAIRLATGSNGKVGIDTYSPGKLSELVAFAHMWLRNIVAQQGVKPLYPAPAAPAVTATEETPAQ